MIRAIFTQTFWQIIGKIVSSLATLVILALVARNYAAEGVGIFTLALTYLAIFNLLSDFGFNAHVLRKKGVKSEWNKLLGTRIIWSVVLVIIAVATLPFWPFTTAEFSQAVLFGSLATVGSAIFVTCNLIFQSRLRYDLSVFASSVGTLISLTFFVYLISQKYPIPYLLLIFMISWTIIALVALILVKGFLPKIMPVFDLRYTKQLFRESWPIAATLSLNIIYFRIDSFLIAFYKGISDVGVYNVAFGVFQSALTLPAFIMNSYYPLMLKSLSKLRLISFGLIILASLGTLTTLILAPVIIDLLTGGQFIGSTQSLQILSLSFPAFFLSSLLMWFLVRNGQYRQMLIIYALGLVINLGLNLMLIPKYSFYAAAWVTVISEYLILIMQVSLVLSNKK